MNFDHFSLFIPLLIGLGVISYLFLSKKKQFFSWIQDHWDFTESNLFKWSEYLIIVSFIALGLLMLDPRGTPRKVTADIQTQRTIIMIDTSTSMLVEDVRPNRLDKAVMLAKHFVKNAIGQQISIMVFSDTYKKIVPFTSDIDLLEARLNALQGLRINNGGTALKLSIQEALQYLKVDKKSGGSGNIVVFTDAEENELQGPLELPETISLALVGVGTAKGGVIPVRDRKGSFKSNKKYKGTLVVSKLNEKVLEKVTEGVPNGKYWIASNYSVPTSEILDFFAFSQKERERKGQVLVKPIMILPFFIIFFLSFVIASLFKLKKPFVMGCLLLLSISVKAQEEVKEKEEKPRNEEVLILEKELQQGLLSIKEKKDLAYLYLKNGETKNAEMLYREVPISKDEWSVRFNKNKAILQNKKFREGLANLQTLKEDLGQGEESDEVKKKINSEILTHLKNQKKEQQKKKQDKKKKKDKKDKKDKKSGASGEGEKKDKDKKKDKKGADKDKKEKKEKKEKDGDKKSKSDEEKKKEEQKQKSSRSKQRMKLKKLPALLKQLMSEDRKLQKKLLDTSTGQRGNQNKKDW